MGVTRVARPISTAKGTGRATFAFPMDSVGCTAKVDGPVYLAERVVDSSAPLPGSYGASVIVVRGTTTVGLVLVVQDTNAPALADLSSTSGGTLGVNSRGG